MISAAMTLAAIGVVAVMILLLAPIPYVARIRHPRQRLFAAYLVLVPARLLARWQACKPPWREGPPP